MEHFVVGGLYFMTWYADQVNQANQDGLVLVIDSLMFLGKNLDPNRQRDTWYFQDANSHCKYGPYPNNKVSGIPSDHYYGNLYLLHEEDLSQIAGCQELSTILTECLARRIKAGKSA